MARQNARSRHGGRATLSPIGGRTVENPRPYRDAALYDERPEGGLIVFLLGIAYGFILACGLLGGALLAGWVRFAP